MTTRLTALLGVLVNLDVLLVAEVFEATSKMGTIRTDIRDKLLTFQNDKKKKEQATDSFTEEISSEVSEERWKVSDSRKRTIFLKHFTFCGSDRREFTWLQALAKELFEQFDSNGTRTEKRNGKLTPRQFKHGLIGMGIYIKNRFFADLCNIIDPSGSGEISMGEWEIIFVYTCR